MYSAVTYAGNGAQTDFVLPFPYLDQAHIEVTVNGLGAAFTFVNPSTVRLAAAPGNGATVAIRRDSNRLARIVDFSDGANLTEGDLDRNSNQLMYLIQEAFDQSTAGPYFDSDAGGARVTNMADPLLDTDGATAGWVRAYVTSISGAGTNLLPLNNIWTGSNTYLGDVAFGGATWFSTPVASQKLLLLDGAGLKIQNTQDAACASIGLWAECKRTTGVAGISDGMIGVLANALQMGTGWNGLGYGAAIGAWKGPGASGETVGILSHITILNPSDISHKKVGLQIEFFNRENGYATGGQSPQFGIAGSGTGANCYNANADAIWVTGYGRSDGGVTYGGWSRGMRFIDEGLDTSVVPAWDSTRAYNGGDYASYGGFVWMAQNPNLNVAPVQGTFWTKLNAGNTVNAVGIDFAGLTSTTMGRMIAAIRLKGQMPIVWDSEGNIATVYDPLTGLWTLKNSTAPRFQVDVNPGDILVNGQRRVLGTRSSVSVHRNLSDYVLGANTWTDVSFPTKERDDRSEFNTGSSVFAPNTPGDYMVSFQAQSTNATAGNRMHAAVLLNGAFYKAAGGVVRDGINTVTVTCLVRMNGTTDQLRFQALSVSSGSLILTGEPAGTFLQISKVS
jgi:hypothetical protein